MLGAMMIDNRLADDLVDRLEPDHFFEPVHGRIFGAIKMARANDMLATPVTLRPMFEQDEGMKELGGPSYLAQLTGSGAGLIGARQFAQQIYDLAMLRTLVRVGRGLVEGAMDTSEEVNPLRADRSGRRGTLQGRSRRRQREPDQELPPGSQDHPRRWPRWRSIRAGISPASPPGIESLNAKIGGMHRSDLMILAGRPGMGKTSLATNIAFNAAQRWMRDMEDGIEPDRSLGAKVAFFSLEMSADQLAGRILSEQARINSDVLRSGKISHQEFRQLATHGGRARRTCRYSLTIRPA